MTDTVEQALRKSHCARKGEEHRCAGSCKITPKGIELSCPICGSDNQISHNYDKKVIERAIRICNVIGITLENMDFDVQRKIIEEIFKDYCPNCKVMHIRVRDYSSCECGWTYSEYKGWSNPNPK